MCVCSYVYACLCEQLYTSIFYVFFEFECGHGNKFRCVTMIRSLVSCQFHCVSCLCYSEKNYHSFIGTRLCELMKFLSMYVGMCAFVYKCVVCG